jgi:2-polyprenyl-6-methoxyphenol hydroxylase-like FAD-dependent oxidoreductase/catechol 2,3-dioxygenase-like lactoylglutathione lyase family enzyme
MVMRAEQSPEVLIVGAGPTGLTLACVLARSGVSCRVIEAAPGPQPGSRGKGVQPRSLEIFDDLGVGDRVLAHGRMAMPIRLTAADGRVTTGGAVPESLRNRPDIPYPASLTTPEWRVEEALRARLGELGGAVEFGATLLGFDQSEQAVTATVVRRGATETITARWVVGCDGGHSTVRKQTGIAFEGETLEDVRVIVADLAVDGLDREAWHMWQHPGGFVTLCPLPSTDAFQYTATIAAGPAPELGLGTMQAILDERTGRADIRLRDLVWSSLWRANIRLADRYRQGRVFLAGDAAHIHSPAGGQGMNTGIQDAYNLGWKLAAVAGGAEPALLDTYAAERRPIAAHVLAFSNERMKEVIGRQELPIRRDASTIQLDVGYRGSALARDDRGPAAALRAGDRAPDATGLLTTDGKHRLFDLIGGGRFTLLSFGPEPASIATRPGLRTLRVVPRPTGPDELADAEGHLAAAYAAGDRTLVLIRPDGYLGLISDAGAESAALVKRWYSETGLNRPGWAGAAALVFYNDGGQRDESPF